METNNQCPDCKKSYEKMPKQCICGWYLINENKMTKDSQRCQYFEENDQCNKAGSVGLRAKSHEWFCSRHAEKIREESYQLI